MNVIALHPEASTCIADAPHLFGTKGQGVTVHAGDHCHRCGVSCADLGIHYGEVDPELDPT